VYFQSPQAADVQAVRKAAEAAGLLGTRIFADRGDGRHVHLADNLAGAVLGSPGTAKELGREELLRVVHPQGRVLVGEDQFVKPFPADVARDDLKWEERAYGPVPLKWAGQIAVRITHRGKRQPTIPVSDEG
jgi:hypothetical protein